MGNQYKTISGEEKKKIVNEIKNILENEENVSFAYLYGSFVNGELVRDVDVAVFLNDKVDDFFEEGLRLGNKLEKGLDFYFPVDLVVLNEAPLYFQYKVLRTGNLIVGEESVRLADFQESVVKEYMDIEPFRSRAIEEILTP